MSRYSRLDTDDERLPEGMTRVGYDADTQVYTFQDADGSYWESAPGCEYGQLTRVSDSDGKDARDTEAFLPDHDSSVRTSWRADMMPLLNFGVLIGLFLLVLFWFLHYMASKDSPSQAPSQGTLDCPGLSSEYTIAKGDTCWAIAEAFDSTVEAIKRDNPDVNCDRLMVGSRICVEAS
jgi:LysM repeat protein